MAGVDRRIAGGEQLQKSQLRLLQVKGRLVIAAGGDRLEVPIPGAARVYAEPVSRFSKDHVPGAFDVGRGEQPAVMPVHPSRSWKVSSLPSPLHAHWVARSGTIELRLFCGTCCSNSTRLLNTGIIGAMTEIVRSE